MTTLIIKPKDFYDRKWNLLRSDDSPIRRKLGQFSTFVGKLQEFPDGSYFLLDFHEVRNKQAIIKSLKKEFPYEQFYWKV